VLHPGSTTHSRMDAEAMKNAGISEDLIRVSVGIESIKDIKNDFSLGLKAAQKIMANAEPTKDAKSASAAKGA